MPGYKDWAPFDVPTAVEFNDYLVGQSVMPFADAAARDAAITTPTDGMVVWLDDIAEFQQRQSGVWVQLNPSAPPDAGFVSFLHHT